MRWYQTAVFQPFFRAHAEFKTKRREPYLFGDEVTRQVKEALHLRYSLLPYLYTLFAQHAQDGSLVMRPLWYEFPADPDVSGTAWWRQHDTPAAHYEALEVEAAERAVAAAKAKAEREAKAESKAAAKAQKEAEAEAKRAAEAAGESTAGAEGGEAAEEEGEGPCPCFKCDDDACHSPDCQTCGVKATSGCNEPKDPGCYTTAEAECSCNAAPVPKDVPYEEAEEADGEEEEEEEAEVAEFKDYNQECACARGCNTRLRTCTAHGAARTARLPLATACSLRHACSPQAVAGVSASRQPCAFESHPRQTTTAWPPMASRTRGSRRRVNSSCLAPTCSCSP